jgi:hypothetical protein
MVGAPPFTVTILPPTDGFDGDFLFSVDTPVSEFTYEALTVTFRGFVVRVNRNLPPPDQLIIKVDQKPLWACDVVFPRPDVVEAMRARHSSDFNDEADLFCGFDSVLPSFLSEHPSQKMDIFVKFRDSLGQDPTPERHLLTIRFNSGSQFYKSDAIGIIAINSIGRSGSSLLSRVLGQHPEVVVPSLEGQYGEVFIMGHFARALALLSSQGSLSYVNNIMIQPEFIMMMSGYSALDTQPDGHEVTLRSRLDQISLQHGRQIYYEALEEVGNYVKRRKPGARFWLEKSWNGISVNLMRAMTKNFKEIILIRNPVDFWRSQDLYHQKIQFSMSERMSHAASTISKYKNLFHSAHDRRNESCIVRYEDLTRHAEATLQRIFTFLEIEVLPEAVAQIVAQIRDGDEFRQRMETGAGGPETSNAFREYIANLSSSDRAELIQFCEIFGYELSES